MFRIIYRVVVAVACAAMLAGAHSAAADAPAIPAGAYVLDKTHASVVFKVSHLGFSFYTASFSRFDATLKFDPTDATVAQLGATIDVTSLQIPAPPDAFLDTLLGPKWFDAGTYPTMTYRSTSVASTGANTARVGFSARGVLNRSDFNMTIGIPPKGSSMGVADSVEFEIETEFAGPPLQKNAG